jgi:hypothetical protein
VQVKVSAAAMADSRTSAAAAEAIDSVSVVAEAAVSVAADDVEEAADGDLLMEVDAFALVVVLVEGTLAA